MAVRFTGRLCSTNPALTYPAYYFKTVSLSSLGYSDSGFPATKTFHDDALALFDGAVGTPTNQSTLDALATQVAKDYYSWFTTQFDRTYSGVLNVAPVGFYDEIIIDYFEDKTTTRIHTAPYNDAPEEISHHDPAAASCTNGNWPSNYVQLYGPNGSGATSIPVFNIGIADGRIDSQYVRTDNLPCACDHHLPGCPCADIPGTLYLHVERPAPAGSENLVVPATLQYGSKPAPLIIYNSDAIGYYSTESYTTPDGLYVLWYWFGCSSGLYFLEILYDPSSPIGYPGRGFVMTWLAGLTGNTCAPFSMTIGATSSPVYQFQGISIDGIGPP